MHPVQSQSADQCGQASAVTICLSSAWFAAAWRKKAAPLITRGYESLLTRFRLRDQIGAHALRTIYHFQFIHVMHWPYVGAPQPREYLDRTYVFFIGNFNGGIGKYVDDFADGVAMQLNFFLRGSAGYQPPYPISLFREYMLSQVVAPRHDGPKRSDRQHYYAAYPQASPRDIVNAFAAAKQFDKLEEALKKKGPENFPERFEVAARAVHGKLSMVDLSTLAPASLIPFTADKANQLTLLCPYDPAHSREIMRLITRINRRPGSPLAVLPELHFGRMLIIDSSTLPCPAGVAPERLGLQSGYLLLNFVFDGKRDAFVRRLFHLCRDTIDTLLRLCYGAGATIEWFEQHVDTCEVRPSWHFRDLPGKSVADVMGALAKQAAFVELLSGGLPARGDLAGQFAARAATITALTRAK